MFCKMNGKYYIKVLNFYQEVKVEDNNIVPTEGEENRLYSPTADCKVATVKEILNANQKTIKNEGKQIKKIF